MYNYNIKTKTMKMRRIDINEEKDIDYLEQIRDSYEKYKTLYIKQNEQELTEILSDVYPDRKISCELILNNKLIDTAVNKEYSFGDMYYPVDLVLNFDDITVKHKNFFALPYMSEMCELNVGGKWKMVETEMKPMLDMSYEFKKWSIMVLSLKNRDLKIEAKPEILAFRHNKKNYDITTIIRAFALEDDILFNARIAQEYFVNPKLKNYFVNSSAEVDATILSNSQRDGICRILKSKRYELGPLRESLNRQLTIDSCVGERLSRPVYLRFEKDTISEGTLITDNILHKLKRNLVNEVYVKKHCNLKGRVLAEDIVIKVLKRGTSLTRYVKENIVKDYNMYTYLPKDLSVNYIIKKNQKITDDISKLLYENDVRVVKCKLSRKNNEDIAFNFEQEIVGNYTVKLSDVFTFEDLQKKGLRGQDYIYYYDIDNLDSITKVEPQLNLNTHDLIAIVSRLMRIDSGDDIEVQNRDYDFRKRLVMVGESLREIFNRAANNYFKFTVRRDTFEKQVLSYPINGVVKNLYRFQKDWDSQFNLYSAKEAIIEDINPIALIDQARKVKTVVSNKSSVPTELRRIPMNSFGKICPFNSPEGPNIGLVTHLATGCKVDDNGIPSTAYYRVIKQMGKTKVDFSRKYYLNSITEQNYNIGDIMHLKYDKEGFLENTKVTAFVPEKLNKKERVTITKVDAHDLDYVISNPNQHLSVSGMFIPFAECDEGVRNSFAMKMLCQTIYIQDGEVPIVQTPMYSDIYNKNSRYIVRAEYDGVIDSVTTKYIAVIYNIDGRESTRIINIRSFFNGSNIAIMTNYYKAVGETFKKGDILADTPISKNGYYSPGRNVLVGILPVYGYNYEDGLYISEDTSSNFVSVGLTEEESEKFDSLNCKVFIKPIKGFNYVSKGQVIHQIRVKMFGKTVTQNFRSKRKSGILIKSEKCRDKDNTRKVYFRADILSIKRTAKGDKMAGRHGNKGVVTQKVPTSKMPRLINGKPLDICINPCGIVSRMNPGQILEGLAGLVGYIFGILIVTEPFNGASRDEVYEMLALTHDICNSNSITEVSGIFNKYPNIPKELIKVAEGRYDYFKEWEGCFDEKGHAILYNPKTGKYFINKILIGIPYFLKLVHEVNKKEHVRAGATTECPYSYITGQPTKGSSKDGGQANGEMELGVLASYGAAEVLREDLNEKCDNVYLRQNLQAIQEGHLEEVYTTRNSNEINTGYFDEEDRVIYPTRFADNFRYQIEAMGLTIDMEGYPGITKEELVKRDIVTDRAVCTGAYKKRHKLIEEEKTKNSDEVLEALDLFGSGEF